MNRYEAYEYVPSDDYDDDNDGRLPRTYFGSVKNRRTTRVGRRSRRRNSDSSSDDSNNSSIRNGRARSCRRTGSSSSDVSTCTGSSTESSTGNSTGSETRNRTRRCTSKSYSSESESSESESRSSSDTSRSGTRSTSSGENERDTSRNGTSSSDVEPSDNDNLTMDNRGNWFFYEKQNDVSSNVRVRRQAPRGRVLRGRGKTVGSRLAGDAKIDKREKNTTGRRPVAGDTGYRGQAPKNESFRSDQSTTGQNDATDTTGPRSYDSMRDLVLSRHSRTINSIVHCGPDTSHKSTATDLERDDILRITCAIPVSDWRDILRSIRGRTVSRDVLFALFVRETEFLSLNRADRKTLLLKVHPDKIVLIDGDENARLDQLVATRLFVKIHNWYQRYKNK